VAADPEDFEGIDVSIVPLGMPPSGCVGGFDAAAGKLTITLSSEVHVLLLGVVSGEVQANGVTCTAADSTVATAVNTASIEVLGSPGDDTLILDLATGAWGAKLLAAGPGVRVDLGTEADTFMLRGSGSPDHIQAGTVQGSAAFDLDGSGSADVLLAGSPAIIVSLGPADDRFDGSGIQGSGAIQLGLAIYGDAGNDTLEGGLGGDTLFGGSGDDLFLTAAQADGPDSYHGGQGRDVMDYGARVAPLSVSLDDVANDGEPGEQDNVASDIEIVVGGAGNDTLCRGRVDVHGCAEHDGV